MKRHCCNYERGCEAHDCDQDDCDDCVCGCMRCGNADTEDGYDDEGRREVALYEVLRSV